ncbi:UNVERIFIED_CONTAM: hypothetical protein K2H54_013741 [Gekko kuhli]
MLSIQSGLSSSGRYQRKYICKLQKSPIPQLSFMVTDKCLAMKLKGLRGNDRWAFKKKKSKPGRKHNNQCYSKDHEIVAWTTFYEVVMEGYIPVSSWRHIPKTT